MTITNYTPGPSQLYFTVEGHVRSAFKEGVPSLSHRSAKFETIFKTTTDGLRELLSLPPDYHIFFTASATETWERIIQNLVGTKCTNLVNGAFSKRFYETAIQLKKSPDKIEVAPGKGFSELNFSVAEDSELIAVTHNETSTGASMPLDLLHQIKDHYPDKLIAVDAVSSLPYPSFDYAKVDSVFFSVQKAFGLPAGLGVWMVNDKCLAKAEHLLAKGHVIGSYHSLPALYKHAQKNQTPETPNVLFIDVLGKVVQDFLRRGITILRKETEYKAALLYQALNNHPLMQPFVKEKDIQSRTVIVADCGDHTSMIGEKLLAKGIKAGGGYGEHKKTQLRFANFPTHSKEQVELLVDTLAEIK